jgi:hypothetical protein
MLPKRALESLVLLGFHRSHPEAWHPETLLHALGGMGSSTWF